MMELDTRTSQIFNELLNDPETTSQALSERLDLTRAQMNYALKKINDSLELEKLPAISRTKNGYFVLPKEVQLTYGVHQGASPGLTTYLNADERKYLLTIILLGKQDYLSLNHFIYTFEVSKNTIMRDLREVRELIAEYDVELQYLRAKGYYLSGTEWDKRQLLIDMINRVFLFENGEVLLLKLCEIKPYELLRYQKRLESIEESLQVRFSDERIKAVSLIILMLFRRVARGKDIGDTVTHNFSELEHTPEYQAVHREFFPAGVGSLSEQLYLTLLLLSMNLTKNNETFNSELLGMRKATKAVIEKFELTAHVEIKNKELLLDKLMVHMKPAYYRIKYGIGLTTIDFADQRNTELAAVIQLVKQSIGPLATYFEKTIDDQELFYLALFFSSHLLDAEEEPSLDPKTAIVVCPNGISVSLLLERNLKNIFPEIVFLGTLSSREFYEKEINVDFIFSSVPLNTKKPIFIVNSFLTEEEKVRLRKIIFKDTKKETDNYALSEKLVSLVKKHTKEIDEEDLFLDILNLLKQDEEMINDPRTLHFVDLIQRNSIQLFEEPIGWSEVLDRLAEPLIEKRIIARSYLETMQQEMPTVPEQIIFRERIALPHTEPDHGAYGVAMSLGICKQGLLGEDKPKVQIVIMLASNDKQKHVDALLEIMDLAGKEELIKQLVSSDNKNQVLKLLNDYTNKYWG